MSADDFDQGVQHTVVAVDGSGATEPAGVPPEGGEHDNPVVLATPLRIHSNDEPAVGACKQLLPDASV